MELIREIDEKDLVQRSQNTYAIVTWSERCTLEIDVRFLVGIYLANVSLGYEPPEEKTLYAVRKAARAVLFNQVGEVALLFVSINQYHKLPGGGLEEKESVVEALQREIAEETGVVAEIIGEVGMTVEYRDRFKQLQISYCYLARVTDQKGKPNYTAYEVAEGFELKWVRPEVAIHLLENDAPLDYIGRFIRKRDTEFLQVAKSMIEHPMESTVGGEEGL